MTQPDSWVCGIALVIAATGVLLGFALSFLHYRASITGAREKAAARRVEIACEALTLANETLFLMQTLPYTLAYEPYQKGANEKRRRASVYTAIVKRLDIHHSYFTRIWSLQPRYMAEFGADRAAIFHKVHEARAEILMRADRAVRDALSDDPYQDLDFWRSAEPSSVPIGEDLARFTSLFREFVDRIQVDCMPIANGRSGQVDSEAEIRSRDTPHTINLLSPFLGKLTTISDLSIFRSRTFRRIRRKLINNYQLGFWLVFAVLTAGIFRLLTK